VKNAK